MPLLFYVQYEVRPLQTNEYWSEAGGAYANCYVLAETAEFATQMVRASLSENYWEIVSLEEGPIVTSRERYLEDPETLESVDEALDSGECYVFHLWPIEPQEGDAVH